MCHQQLLDTPAATVSSTIPLAPSSTVLLSTAPPPHLLNMSSSSSSPASSSSPSPLDNNSVYQRPTVSVEIMRCIRCARAAEATSTDDISASGMVRVGHNIYYCHRCAKLVGYI